MRWERHRTTLTARGGGCAMCWRFRRQRNQSGQATVEAAVAIPVVFLLLLLLVQPAIVLYDRAIMENAAAETCRLLCTQEDPSLAEDYLSRRLSAIPEMELFHKHAGGCSWDIQLTSGASVARVEVATRLKPLPLLAQLSQLAGLVDGEGYWEVRVQEELPTTAMWKQ